MKKQENIEGSLKNIWYGVGRQRIEIPKPVLKSGVQTNSFLKQLHICTVGYYPKAKGHYTVRKKGLPENFLFFCVDGRGWYKIKDKKYEVRPNEFFILPQNVSHGYGSIDSDPWSIYWIHFGGDSLPALNNLQTVQNHFKPVHIKSTGEILSLFTKIFHSLELGYSIDNLMFANMCLQYFITFFIYNNKHYPASDNHALDCVDKAILFMQEKISRNISLHDLSERYNYSPSRFSGLFKQKTGHAPIDYFIQMKMQKAMQQLDFTNASVKEIALSLGFDDPYYFSRRFSKLIGMSPTKYRATNKD